jgi:quercetin dioxygenase-like cupin family protein
MSEPNQKAKKLLINRDGLKVIRLCLNQGETLPEHATNADVVVTVLNGEGTFTIEGVPQAIKSGDVLDLKPNVPHAVIAKEALELIVVHMHLAQQQAEVSCGTDTCHK